MCHKDHPLAALEPISWPESMAKDAVLDVDFLVWAVP